MLLADCLVPRHLALLQLPTLLYAVLISLSAAVLPDLLVRYPTLLGFFVLLLLLLGCLLLFFLLHDQLRFLAAGVGSVPLNDEPLLFFD